MLEEFQLTAILKVGNQYRLLRLPLHQELQHSLAEIWDSQYRDFVEGAQEIEFDPGYRPEEHERFRLLGYDLPEGMNGETRQTIPDLEAISNHEDVLDSIKGIAAFARDDQGNEMILFQNFSRSRIIQPGRFLFLENNTYQTAQRPGLSLDHKLAAVYFPEDRKLLFFNFRITNTFLPLASFYKEASEQEVRDILAHESLEPEDAEALADGPSQWFRKRFAMLRDSQILDDYSPQQIADHSDGFEVDVQLSNGRIVFPADKGAAKRLLQFLNEEIFRGAITETLYETNSKREAD